MNDGTHLDAFLYRGPPHFLEDDSLSRGALGNARYQRKRADPVRWGLLSALESHQGIPHKLQEPKESGKVSKAATFGATMAQIAVFDIIFSLDSVITAAGMADYLAVMMLAVVISIGVMMIAASSIGDFISKHPSVKMLALSFLILIGTALIAEGFHFGIPKGYIYFAMAFSLGIELLNLKIRSKSAAKTAH
jgi:predicted tellurium resistance membrane protein TerC